MAYNNRGVVYGIIKKYDEAISDFNKAIEINPNYVDAHYNRGIIHCYKREYDKALSDYDGLIKIHPIDGVAYFSRGFVYYFKEEYDKSWEDVETAQDMGYEIPLEFLDDLRNAPGRQE